MVELENNAIIRKKITIPLHQKESVSAILTVPSSEKGICNAGMIVAHDADDPSFHIPIYQDSGIGGP